MYTVSLRSKFLLCTLHASVKYQSVLCICTSCYSARRACFLCRLDSTRTVSPQILCSWTSSVKDGLIFTLCRWCGWFYVSLIHDLRRALKCFPAESDFLSLVLIRWMLEGSLWVGVLSQPKFQYLLILFMADRRVDQQIGASSAKMRVLHLLWWRSCSVKKLNFWFTHILSQSTAGYLKESSEVSRPPSHLFLVLFFLHNLLGEYLELIVETTNLFRTGEAIRENTFSFLIVTLDK